MTQEEKAIKTLNKADNILYDGGFKFIYWGGDFKEENGIKTCSIMDYHDFFAHKDVGTYKEKPNHYILYYDDNTETTFLLTRTDECYFEEIKGYLNTEDSEFADEKTWYIRNEKEFDIKINKSDIIVFAENNIDEDRRFAILKPSDSHKILAKKIYNVYSSCVEKGFDHRLLFRA